MSIELNVNSFLQERITTFCRDHKQDIVNTLDLEPFSYRINGESSNAKGHEFQVLNEEGLLKLKSEVTNRLSKFFKKGITCRKICLIAFAIFIGLLTLSLATAPLLGTVVTTIATVLTLTSGLAAVASLCAVLFYSFKCDRVVEPLARNQVFLAQDFLSNPDIKKLNLAKRREFADFVADQYAERQAKEALENVARKLAALLAVPAKE